jgi:predicted protein tyrosine phosphatase
VGDITILDLADAKRLHHRFAAVLTIEDVDQAERFRLPTGDSRPHLVLTFDDVTEATPGRRLATSAHLDAALEFARNVGPAPLLIHCNSGISRSPAVAVAVASEQLGQGCEEEAIAQIAMLRSVAVPNIHVVAIADTLLKRQGTLLQAVVKWSAGRGWNYPAAWQVKAGQIGMPALRGTAPQSAGTLTASVSRLIAAPRERLFAYVANPFNDPQWIDAISSVRQLNGGPAQVGTRFEQTAVGPIGKAEVIWKVVRLDPPSHMSVESLSGEYQFTGGYNLASVGGQTRITKFATFSRSGMLLAVPQGLGQLLMSRLFERWLNGLARVARSW